MSAVAVTSAEEQQIQQQLREVETRLVDHYGGRHAGVSEKEVREVTARVSRRLADAQVRTFVPILVERAVRRELDR